MTQALVVDDVPATVHLPDTVAVVMVSPQDDGFALALAGGIADADVILVDQELDIDNAALSMRAPDGASLVAHFRSWARRENLVLAPIVLITSQEESYKLEVPAVGPPLPLGGSFRSREHRIAPTLDVEWLLWKEDPEFGAKAQEIGEAYRRATEVFGNGGASFLELEALLALPDVDWATRARVHLARAQPPISEAAGQGGAFPARGPTAALRWLLHRALPFPAVFLSDRFAAWSLGATVESFVAWIDGPASGEAHALVSGSVYGGVFERFLGRRWWTAGLDQAAWLLGQKTVELRDRTAALGALSGGVLQPLADNDMVVTWNDDFTECDVVPIADAVEVHPPGWPANALEPWMRRDEVQGDKILEALVDPDDRELQA
ncbi:hypothetical protein [Phenylobacterium sp.]|uniref:hypothetical protein n=1 Tax=Phenylobacterium sp. TaxID=1871053 RepID=UPI002FCC5313